MKKTEKDDNAPYRVNQFRIKKGHELFGYCDDICFKAKNLYNVSNFFVRQAFSGLRKDPSERHDNENFVIGTVNSRIGDLNQIKVMTHQRKLVKNPTAKASKPFSPIREGASRIHYPLLEGVLKLENHPDYRALPAHTNQNVIKQLSRDWDSFFASILEYRVAPDKFLGRPRPPRYAEKDGRKTVTFTNQVCKVKENRKTGRLFLSFPKTKLTLDLGEIDFQDRKLMEVRIVPNANFYTIEAVFRLHDEDPPLLAEEADRILGIDLGVNNFATISNNIGLAPIVVKGGMLKSRNQFYNKQRAHFFGVLRQGMKPNQGLFNSRRLYSLDTKRHSFFKDFFHKLAKTLVSYCIENNIDTIVVGKNKLWKQEVKMRRADKQSFVAIPYCTFLSILEYKARRVGIRFVTTEESYTSKASFLDRDIIPVYGETDDEPAFSGRRVSRGMYRAADGTLINADVNGSANIVRKVFPTAFDGGRDSGVVKAPTPLSVA